MGDKDDFDRVPLSYLYRNDWDQYGLADAAEGEQWWDYQAGANLDGKSENQSELFAEGEYTQMWDSKFFITTFGINYTFR